MNIAQDWLWMVKAYRKLLLVAEGPPSRHYDLSLYQDSIKDLDDNPTEFLSCLPILLAVKDWEGNTRTILEALPHELPKLDLTDLLNTMARLNLPGRELRMPLADLDTRLLPLLYVPDDSDEETLVLLSANEKGILAYHARSKLVKQVDNMAMHGTAYIFTKRTPETLAEATKLSLRRLLTRFRSLFYKLMLITMLIDLMILSLPIFIRSIYDQVIPSHALSTLASLLIGVLIALMGALGLQMMRTRILAYVGSRLDNLLGNFIIQKILELPPSFTENVSVGVQLARIKDFDGVRDFLTSPVVGLIFEIPFTIVFLVAIYVIGGVLCLIPIFMTIIFLVFIAFIEPLIESTVTIATTQYGKRQIFLLEALTNVRTLKYLHAENRWLNRYKEVSSQATMAGLTASIISASIGAVSDFILYSSGLFVLTWGVFMVLNHELTIGGLIAVMILVWRVLSPIKQFFISLPKINQIRSSLKQVDALLGLESERNYYTGTHTLSKLSGPLELQRVSFRYRADYPPALIGVSFTVPPGEVVCLIGKNGSGKSTLLKVICGLYSPQAGGIRFSNMDTHQFHPIDLRQGIGYLPQIPKLFYGTIEQNLRLAYPTATLAEIEQALQLANVYVEVMGLPKGLQTRLNDQSMAQLSMSFVQRMALARTYLKPTHLFLLDEPTTALDADGDQALVNAINHFRRKATLVIVTHRPTHLKLADRVLFMDQGQLVFNGPPSEVLPRIPKEFL
jgi:ATP-binding cassette, subfamily C, bacterial LapB